MDKNAKKYVHVAIKQIKDGVNLDEFAKDNRSCSCRQISTKISQSCVRSGCDTFSLARLLWAFSLDITQEYDIIVLNGLSGVPCNITRYNHEGKQMELNYSGATRLLPRATRESVVPNTLFNNL